MNIESRMAQIEQELARLRAYKFEELRPPTLTDRVRSLMAERPSITAAEIATLTGAAKKVIWVLMHRIRNQSN